MPNKKSINKQVSQYDKILQENIEAAVPGLIKKVLKINVAYSEELPDSIQHTKERKPDVLKKITDSKGNVFVLHIEFQTKDDADMAYRMAEYLIMLARRYRLAVKQYVIYIGEGRSGMPSSLLLGNSYFVYELIAISSIGYRTFLRAKKPEEKMFALLGNFGKENVKTVFTKIATEILQATHGELEKEQRKNQLRVLVQLRTLVSENIDIMEHVSSFFKEENDIFYRVGERKGLEKGIEQGIEKGLEQGIEKGLEQGIEKGLEQGIEKGLEEKSFQVVKNLLLVKKFTNAEIANFAGVTESFVRKVKRALLQQKK